MKSGGGFREKIYFQKLHFLEIGYRAERGRMMFCPNCGNEIKDDAVFCASCGERIALEKNAEFARLTPKNEPSKARQGRAVLIAAVAVAAVLLVVAVAFVGSVIVSKQGTAEAVVNGKDTSNNWINRFLSKDKEEAGVTDIVFSDSETVYLTENGDVYMWGYYGGDAPTKILDNAVKIISGNKHNTFGAILEDGSLYMWGNNEFGQLGNGTIEGSLVPIKILDNVADVTTADSFCMAIMENGDLYTWGSGFYGGLGNGTTEISLLPEKVLENVVNVETGCRFWSGSPSTVGAVTKNGDLYMWGASIHLAIEDKMIKNSLTPTKILENVSDNIKFGAYYNGGLIENGALHVWSGSLPKYCYIPQKVLQDVENFDIISKSRIVAITQNKDLYINTRLTGEIDEGAVRNNWEIEKILENVRDFRCNSGILAAVTENGDLYTWLCTFDSFQGPNLIDLKNVSDIVLGSSVYGAITEDGDLYMWGNNTNGQVGNGTLEDTQVPEKILENVADIRIGDNVCAAFTENGDLYMWGSNRWGQIGNGSNGETSVLTPQKIVFGE